MDFTRSVSLRPEIGRKLNEIERWYSIVASVMDSHSCDWDSSLDQGDHIIHIRYALNNLNFISDESAELLLYLCG